MPAGPAASAATSAPKAAGGDGGGVVSSGASIFLGRFNPCLWAETCRNHVRVEQGLMLEPRTWHLVVASVQDLTPHMRRIQLTAPSLGAFEYLPGQDLALGLHRDG